jgi:hypothetical protein
MIPDYPGWILSVEISGGDVLESRSWYQRRKETTDKACIVEYVLGAHTRSVLRQEQASIFVGNSKLTSFET